MTSNRVVSVTMVSNLGILALSVGPAIFAARMLGPDGRGALAAAMVWASLAATVAQVGLPQALTYSAAAGGATPAALFSMALWAAVMQGAALALVSWMIEPAVASMAPQYVRGLRFAAFVVPFTLVSTHCAAVLQGLRRTGPWNTSRVIAAAAYPAALLSAIVSRSRDIDDVLFRIVIATACAAALVVAGVACMVTRPGRVAMTTWGQVLSYGIRVSWGNIAWLVNARLDQLVLGLMMPFAALGNYAVAASMATSLMPIPAAFASTTFARVPAMVAAERRHAIGSAAWRAVALTGLAAVLLAGASPWLVPFVFGQAFSAAVIPAVLLLGGTVVLGLNYVLSDALRGLNRPARVAAIETAAVVVTGGLLWWLVPRFGILGAAVASVLSYLAIAIALIAEVRRATHLPRVGEAATS
jgi:O-antigen/teichoic acid export membrane protein